MKLDFDIVITTIKGEPMKGPDDETFTLGAAITTAAFAPLEDDKKLSGADKARLYKIALATTTGSELSVEDVSFIKERIGMVFGPAVVGPVFELMA